MPRWIVLETGFAAVIGLALYIVSLALASGLVGVFARQMLGEAGYVYGFRMELASAGGAACAYASVQLLYMAVVRGLKPTRSSGPVYAEVFSQLGALALAPQLLQVPIPWPYPILAKAAPLLFLGAFAAIHGFFKLASFYAAIRGEPCGRLGALGWLGASGVSGLAAVVVLVTWLGEADQARPEAPDQMDVYRVGDAYALARVLPEGAELTCEISASPGNCLSLRWAMAPPAEDDTGRIDRIYVTVGFEGGGLAGDAWPVNLDPDGWAELRIAADQVPSDARKCTVVWDGRKAPSWRKLVPVRPVVTSHRRALVSGPFQHEQRREGESESSVDPSFVVLVIEGLGADRLSGAGHGRNVTPSLDRFAHTALAFSRAYTPAPEAAAACMTLLTGMNPLRHEFLGAHNGPLPQQYDTLAEVLRRRHYATAAFTEGEAKDDKDLVFGSGFQRGFEVFDASYRATAAEKELAGSAATLAKAAAWIESHADTKFLVFVRLRELRDPRWSDRYAPGFATNASAPSRLDVYDSALLYVDKHVGELLKRLRATDASKTTCVVITSPYGLDFGVGETVPTVGLTEGSLRVPLLVSAPGVNNAGRAGLVALEDVVPTLLTLAHTGVDYLVDGKELLQNPADRAPVSMFGAPLALSLRVDRWRFSWQSGQAAFGEPVIGASSILELYDVVQTKKRGYKLNEMGKYPELVTRYRARLEDYLNEHTAAKSRAK